MPNSEFFGLSPLSDKAFSELLPCFFEEIIDDFKKLKNYSEVEDWIQVRSCAHKIKGTAASYSAKLIFEAALNLQSALEENYTVDNSGLINKLELAINHSFNYAKIHLIRN